MKKIFFFLTFFYLGTLLSAGQDFKLFLIGDTGEDTVLQSTMQSFLDTISKYPNSAVVFLGDNCYKRWIVGERKGFDSSEITIKRLGIQLNGLNQSKYNGNVYFIPGNHEWWNVTCFKKGKRNVLREEAFIEKQLGASQSIKNNYNTFLPDSGNPVAAVELNDGRLKLIIIDTEWLIVCKNKIERLNGYAQIDSILKDAIGRHLKIVVAAHHPIFTLGKHSKKHWNQFPKFYKNQDIYNPIYKEVRMRLDSLLTHKNYPIVYSSGHDHVLEYFKKDSVEYIVSGSGSKTTSFSGKDDFNPNPEKDMLLPVIKKVNEGFFELNFVADKTEIFLFYFDNGFKKVRVN